MLVLRMKVTASTALPEKVATGWDSHSATHASLSARAKAEMLKAEASAGAC